MQQEPQPLGTRRFVDGSTRTVYLDPAGKQYNAGGKARQPPERFKRFSPTAVYPPCLLIWARPRRCWARRRIDRSSFGDITRFLHDG
jgi:hypothetical protein